MKKYKIKYIFDGLGDVKIEAKTSHEAREKFFNGDFSNEDDNEGGENYTIEDVELIK